MFRFRLARVRARFVLFHLLAALAALAGRAPAQTVHWATNFYAVTGTNFREIRQSIARARPWKDDFDGDTRWRVAWNFNTVQTANGCACTGFHTTTTLTITAPRWTPPAGVLPEVKEQWTRYFTNLLQHEAGHARLALDAASEIQKRISAVTAGPDCAQLRDTINQRAEKVVADYRAREAEYDRRTEHGRRREETR
jgi:predicted secreted Zn-dependent protease